jgi:hypothetical protein
MLGLNLFLLVMLEHFATTGCTIRFSSGHENPTQSDCRQTLAQEQSS